MTAARHGLRRLIAPALLGAFLAGSAVPAAEAEGEVVIFAAASLRNALDNVAAAWNAETGKTAIVSYAGSSALARQIESGAPADIFISADLAWMDYLGERHLIAADTRQNLLGNEIVLIAPADSTVEAEISHGFPLAELLGDGRLAMADVAAVPAGKYGKASLEALGVWDLVANRIAQAEDVRAALALVSRGEAPLGIVYRTDAAADPGVRVVGVFPGDSHPPIVYPVAVTADSANPDAAALLEFIESPEAEALFEKEGFTVLD